MTSKSPRRRPRLARVADKANANNGSIDTFTEQDVEVSPDRLSELQPLPAADTPHAHVSYRLGRTFNHYGDKLEVSCHVSIPCSREDALSGAAARVAEDLCDEGLAHGIAKHHGPWVDSLEV